MSLYVLRQDDFDQDDAALVCAADRFDEASGKMNCFEIADPLRAIVAARPGIGSSVSRTVDALHSFYRTCLSIAWERRIRKVAVFPVLFPATAIPLKKSVDAAVEAIEDFLSCHEMEVFLLLPIESFQIIGNKRYEAIERYVRSCLGAPKPCFFSPRLLRAEMDYDAKICGSDIASVIERLDEGFSECLMSLIAKKGMGEVECYRRANVDRKLFSKIRSDRSYRVSKNTAIAFAIALRLDLDETQALLGKAGYVLTHSSKRDIIVEYFIKRKIYDVLEINEALFSFDQPLLGQR